MIDFPLSIAGLTDTGRVRERNEDAIAWDAEIGAVLLADGMGGHSAGDVASHLALDTLHEVLRPALERPLRIRPNRDMSRHATLVRRAINKANERIHAVAQQDPARAGMGTTLAMALFHDARVVIGHVGDSRVYRLRGGRLERLTSDHSVAEELVRQGAMGEEDVAASPYRHVITRALGLEPKVTATIEEHEVVTGDVFLLCSDGLSDLVADAELEAVLTGLDPDSTWDQAVHALAERANALGGEDNISVIIVQAG
ncbi:MAG: Stp1/IreP family PP2C-type Ser/Thr phosphatase [Gammaproteobacteria bacterium]|nr:Stp1/IreP family PP2C-type Ser/Thr phosphatase [Gammaproteobacteria bacterium]